MEYCFAHLAVLLVHLVDLPARTPWLFFVAGAIYVGGALGMELVEGMTFHAGFRRVRRQRVMLNSIEESMEMIGVVIFIRAVGLPGIGNRGLRIKLVGQ